MNTKKMLGLALSGAMALSMTVPALAADTTISDLSDSAELEITGTTQVPKIEVVVPATGEVILNPYGMTVANPPTGATATDQILSAVQAIENKSEIAIKVSGTITGVAEGVTLTTSTPDNTKKEVKLTFKIAKSADATTAPTGTGVDLTTSAQDIAAAAVELDKTGGSNPFATFQLSGSASKNPESVWTADDVIGATVAFTFEPNAPTT